MLINECSENMHQTKPDLMKWTVVLVEIKIQEIHKDLEFSFDPSPFYRVYWNLTTCISFVIDITCLLKFAIIYFKNVLETSQVDEK